MDERFITQIDEYLLGRLSNEEKEQLLSEINSNEELNTYFLERENLISALQAHEEINHLQEQLDIIHDEEEGEEVIKPRRIFRKRRRVSKRQKWLSTLGIAASVSVIMSITLAYILTKKDHVRINEENHTISAIYSQIEKNTVALNELQNDLKEANRTLNTITCAFPISVQDTFVTILPEEASEIWLIDSVGSQHPVEVISHNHQNGVAVIKTKTVIESDKLKDDVLATPILPGYKVYCLTLFRGEKAYFEGVINYPSAGDSRNFKTSLNSTSALGSPVFINNNLVGIVSGNDDVNGCMITTLDNSNKIKISFGDIWQVHYVK